jgi:hypothetical protein
MVYCFKTKATGDVVMLQENGKRLLEILGKDPAGPGILLVEQMPAAIQAIHQAIEDDALEFERKKQEAMEKGEYVPDPERVSLKTRLHPFLTMLGHCQRENAHVTWGV